MYWIKCKNVKKRFMFNAKDGRVLLCGVSKRDNTVYFVNAEFQVVREQSAYDAV